MERIDEIITMFEKAKCPKEYKNCPLYEMNDCDNYCPFTEAADLLIDLKGKQVPVKMEIEGEGKSFWWYVCSECHTRVTEYDKFCRECGRPFEKIAKNSTL